MSDEIFDSEDEGGDEQQSQAGKRKIGFLPAVVIDILKWTAIVVGAIIFVVVTVVITVRTMNAGNQATATRLPLQSEYEEGSAPLLEWFSQIGEVRGTTADEVRKTFIVSVHIGYDPQNAEATLQELLRREVQITEAIAEYFSSRTVEELEGIENRQRAKQELREEINRIMSNDIREVAFARYEFIEF
jgi:flagellar FliL protein